MFEPKYLNNTMKMTAVKSAKIKVLIFDRVLFCCCSLLRAKRSFKVCNGKLFVNIIHNAEWNMASYFEQFILHINNSIFNS